MANLVDQPATAHRTVKAAVIADAPGTRTWQFTPSVIERIRERHPGDPDAQALAAIAFMHSQAGAARALAKTALRDERPAAVALHRPALAPWATIREMDAAEVAALRDAFRLPAADADTGLALDWRTEKAAVADDEATRTSAAVAAIRLLHRP